MRNYSKILNLLRKESNHTEISISSEDRLKYETIVEAGFSSPKFTLDNENVRKSYEYVQQLAKDRKAMYGVTTSFGGNVHHIIPPEQAKLLQRNLILSHATNVGEHFPYHVSKGALTLRLHTLSQGYSGVNPKTLELMGKMLELGLVPVINIHGSLGASGDIAPLAAIALTLIGEGYLWLPDGTTILPSAVALKQFNLSPLVLSYKEGLALLNGTSMMTTVSSFNLHYLKRLLENSLAVSALTLQALRASTRPFDERLHKLKPHAYEIKTAKVMADLLKDGKFARSHEQFKEAIDLDLQKNTEAFYSKVDLQGGSYSLRAIPQIYHPILDAFENLRTTTDTEISAIDDNPLVLPDEHEELHGANFHGYAISVASDTMNIAIAGVSNISLARIDRILKSHHSNLPWFLATGTEGLYLGMHGVQFTAAGIGAEIHSLTTPLSTTQFVTNNDNQDFVSFGLQSTVKGLEMTVLTAYVVAIEWMCAVQAIWLLLQDKESGLSLDDLAPGTCKAYEVGLKIYTPIKDQDQVLTEAVEKLAEKILLDELLPLPVTDTIWK